MFKRKYVVLRTVFDKNKALWQERKKDKNNDKLKQNETNSN